MPKTIHHDLINKDYSGRIKYIYDLELSIDRKLTKFEKDFINDTFRTITTANNQWSRNDKSDISFNINKEIFTKYITKYRKSYKKTADLYCIELYDKIEDWLIRMDEREKRNLNKLCNDIKEEITEILAKLDYINFDYDFNGHFFYKRNPSNNKKRHYVSLLDKQSIWANFANEYNEKHLYIQLKQYFCNTNGQDYIRYLFRVYADLSLHLKNNDYDKCLKAIISISFKKEGWAIKQDRKLLAWRDKLEEIANMILDKKYDEAYEIVMKFINEKEKWYVRGS